MDLLWALVDEVLAHQALSRHLEVSVFEEQVVLVHHLFSEMSKRKRWLGTKNRLLVKLDFGDLLTTGRHAGLKD